MAEALRQPAPLGDVLLERWLALAASWILIGELREAMPLLEALTTECTSVEACSQPVPSRPALVLLALLHLLREKAPPPAPGRCPAAFVAAEHQQRAEDLAGFDSPVLCLLAGRGDAPFTAAQSQVLASVWPFCRRPRRMPLSCGIWGCAIRRSAGAWRRPMPSPIRFPCCSFLPAPPRHPRFCRPSPRPPAPPRPACPGGGPGRRPRSGRGPSPPAPGRSAPQALARCPALAPQPPDDGAPGAAADASRAAPAGPCPAPPALTPLVHATECLLRLDGAEPALPPWARAATGCCWPTRTCPSASSTGWSRKRQQLERLGCEVRIVLREHLWLELGGRSALGGCGGGVPHAGDLSGAPLPGGCPACRPAPLVRHRRSALRRGPCSAGFSSSFGGSISASTHRSLCLDGMLFQQPWNAPVA